MHLSFLFFPLFFILVSCKTNTKNNLSTTSLSVPKDSLIIDYTPLSTGTFTDDRDNKTYKWVQLRDGKTWMAENLNYEMENTWCYYNKAENCDKFGRLYSFDAALKACPKGWYLPSQAEWTQLLMIYGNSKELFFDNVGYEASKQVFQLFKESGESGFDLSNCGLRMHNGFLYPTKDLTEGYYWSATKVDETHASYYLFNSKSKRVTRWNQFDIRKSGFACRCVKEIDIE